MYIYTAFQHVLCPPQITNRSFFCILDVICVGNEIQAHLQLLYTLFLSLNQPQASVASAQVCSLFSVNRIDKDD